jgi:penicillin-binding protein 1A
VATSTRTRLPTDIGGTLSYNKVMSQLRRGHSERSGTRISNDRSSTKLRLIILLALSVFTGSLLGLLYYSMSDLPAINSLEEYSPAESSLIFSSDGKELAELYLERRTFIPGYEIPDYVKKAFVAIEDARFYHHSGVDIIGIMRALLEDIKTGSMAQGGSTITQQLAKMLFLKPEKSIIRKLKEAAISMQIEKRYTKDEILGLYLNQAYFGTQAYGIEAASQTYFGKSATRLTIGEAALLASLPKAPSYYSPFRNPGRSRERRSLVLKEMLANNFITRTQYKNARIEPMPVRPHFRKYEAPYFTEMLRRDLESDYDGNLYKAGYRIYSTIDYRMQKAAEEAVKKGIAAVDKRDRKGVQAALVAMEINSGAIRAMVGGTDFWENQFNRATQALRQPGSSFKPFVYLTAIECGMTPDDQIMDEPVSFRGARPGHPWEPKNYEGEYHGEVTLKTALAESLNAATVNLADELGVRNIIDTARKLGIKTVLHPYLSIALGASDVTLMEMVSAYNVFATGKYVKPRLYDWIVDRNGISIREAKPETSEVVSHEDVELMRELLHAVVEEGTGRRARELKRTLYGKTGTTNDYTDAWFIGFDDRLVVGVWVGRDNHKPIGPRETGARAALPIWMDFMKTVHSQIPAN